MLRRHQADVRWPDPQRGLRLLPSSILSAAHWLDVVSSSVNDRRTGENLLQSARDLELADHTPLACMALCHKNGCKLAGVGYRSVAASATMAHVGFNINEYLCEKGYKNGKKPAARPAGECSMARAAVLPLGAAVVRRGSPRSTSHLP